MLRVLLSRQFCHKLFGILQHVRSIQLWSCFYTTYLVLLRFSFNPRTAKDSVLCSGVCECKLHHGGGESKRWLRISQNQRSYAISVSCLSRRHHQNFCGKNAFHSVVLSKSVNLARATDVSYSHMKTQVPSDNKPLIIVNIIHIILSRLFGSILVHLILIELVNLTKATHLLLGAWSVMPLSRLDGLWRLQTGKVMNTLT